MVVGGKDRRLHEVDATPTHVFLDANEEIAFREAQHLSRPRLHVQVLADLERQLRTAAAAEDEDIVCRHSSLPIPMAPFGELPEFYQPSTNGEIRPTPSSPRPVSDRRPSMRSPEPFSFRADQ